MSQDCGEVGGVVETDDLRICNHLIALGSLNDTRQRVCILAQLHPSILYRGVRLSPGPGPDSLDLALESKSCLISSGPEDMMVSMLILSM